MSHSRNQLTKNWIKLRRNKVDNIISITQQYCGCGCGCGCAMDSCDKKKLGPKH